MALYADLGRRCWRAGDCGFVGKVVQELAGLRDFEKCLWSVVAAVVAGRSRKGH